MPLTWLAFSYYVNFSCSHVLIEIHLVWNFGSLVHVKNVVRDDVKEQVEGEIVEEELSSKQHRLKVQDVP